MQGANGESKTNIKVEIFDKMPVENCK